MEEIRRLANGLSERMGLGGIAAVEETPLGEGEQGYSGAEMFRLNVTFDDGRRGSFICKKAELWERMVMETLTTQGRGHTPAAYSGDCVSDAPAWMLQQDLGRWVAAPRENRQWMALVADALAGIHADNMNCGAQTPWLPHADREYWKTVVGKLSVDHFERMIESDPDFARQYSPLLPELRRAGERFAGDMAAMYGEHEWLTLVHGDLQGPDGDHVYNVSGKPYFIDFGFARYAPFYVDLADYFSMDGVRQYHRALNEKGFELSWKNFEERYRAAHRYPGFIYMYPGIVQWKRGSGERLQRLLDRILA